MKYGTGNYVGIISGHFPASSGLVQCHYLVRDEELTLGEAKEPAQGYQVSSARIWIGTQPIIPQAQAMHWDYQSIYR